MDLSNAEAAKGGDEGPSFGDNMGSEAFRKACRDYAEWAIDYYDTFDDITLENVRVEVSTALKKAAGKAGGELNPEDLYMRFAVGAYEKWGWGEEIESTIRHEIVHIRQYKVNGDGGHGLDFKQMANEVDTPVHCKKFTEFKYGIFCGECDEQVTGRYRACKITKKPMRYNSKCCGKPCYSKEL